MRLLVITNLLPHYQIDFFNKLVALYPEIELTVVADIKYQGSLNGYKDDNCHFNVINNKMYEKKGLIFRKGILKVIKENKPDKLIFYANPREISLTFIMMYLKVIGFKFYAHGMFHRVGGQRFVSNVYYRLMGFLAEKLFIYSRKGAEILLTLGIDPKKINIVGTAIDETKAKYYLSQIKQAHINELVIKYNLTNKKVILQVVRLSKIKKPEMLVDVANKILSERDDCVFILIGDGEQYLALKNKISEYKLDNKVFLLGAIYDELELAHWFSLAKVFVMPTCIGLSAHHAFSYGLPIVTDDNLLEQASEFDILADGLNSVVYKAGNIDSFSKSILTVIDDEDYQAFLSRNALFTIEKVHSLKNKCFNYYNGILNN